MFSFLALYYNFKEQCLSGCYILTGQVMAQRRWSLKNSFHREDETFHGDEQPRPLIKLYREIWTVIMTLPISRPLTYQRLRALISQLPVVTTRFKSTSGGNQNIDREEVLRFQKLSQEWWDPNGPLKSLVSMNRLRVPFIRDGILSTEVGEELPNRSPGKPLTGLKVCVWGSQEFVFIVHLWN